MIFDIISLFYCFLLIYLRSLKFSNIIFQKILSCFIAIFCHVYNIFLIFGPKNKREREKKISLQKDYLVDRYRKKLLFEKPYFHRNAISCNIANIMTIVHDFHMINRYLMSCYSLSLSS